MPFGLKNAPQIFQRMMDRIFGKYSFILVSIDDILVFSKTFPEHIKHLELDFEELINNGLIVSRKKIKLFKNQIEFLGLELENGQVKLQEHIVQKINNFPDKLEDLKTLQSFLGLLNYARPYIKNLSQLAGPLYSKTKITGQKYCDAPKLGFPLTTRQPMEFYMSHVMRPIHVQKWPLGPTHHTHKMYILYKKNLFITIYTK